jgi:ectoine hydroxylase-related dioxygenase (phytanoyl-CoA dioxygenase family)
MAELTAQSISPGRPPKGGLVNLAQYHDHGYCIVPEVFDAKDLDILRDASNELTEMARDFKEDHFVKETYFNMFRPCDPFDREIKQKPAVPGIIRRVTYPYAVNKKINQMRHHPKLLSCVAEILGDELVQIVNQVNFNPPNIGTGWGWHQDYRFRRHGIQDLLDNFVQCLTAIDTSSNENGGFRLVPHSHKLGSLTLDLDIAKAESFFDASQAVLPTLQPGDTIFFNAFMIHGSGANRSPHQRRVFINGYARASAASHGNPVLSAGKIVFNAKDNMEFEQDQAKLPLAAKY